MKVHICSTCGDGYAEETDVPKAGHSFGEWTDIGSGDRQRSCTACGFTETDYNESSVHHFADEMTVDKEATADSDGSRSFHCTVR